jgi:hypothetical protein
VVLLAAAPDLPQPALPDRRHLGRHDRRRRPLGAAHPRPGAGATPELYLSNDAIPEIFHHKPLGDFFADAAAGALPSFSFLDPGYDTQSPPGSITG